MKPKVRLLFGKDVYRFYLITEGELGYIVVTKKNHLDFYQCIDLWAIDEPYVAVVIREVRSALTKLVFCGSLGLETEDNVIGIDSCFSQMYQEEEDTVKEHVKSFEKEINAELKTQRQQGDSIEPGSYTQSGINFVPCDADIIRRLLKEFRYTDAQEHCRRHDLDYEYFQKKFGR